MIFDFDVISITEDHKYHTCNNLICNDLIANAKYSGFFSDSGLSICEHPYASLCHLELMPTLDFTTRAIPIVPYTRSLIFNKLSLFFPLHIKNNCNFAWKKHWKDFYVRCQKIQKDKIKHLEGEPYFEQALVYIFQQNIMPVIYIQDKKYSVRYEPISLYSELVQNTELSSLISTINKIILTIHHPKEKWCDFLFHGKQLETSYKLNLSFVSYLKGYFSILNLQKCKIVLLPENRVEIDYSKLDEFDTLQLKHTLSYIIEENQISEQKIEKLKQLGCVFNKLNLEPNLLLEAQLVKDATNLFDSIWEFQWRILIENKEYSEIDFRNLVQQNDQIIKDVNNKIISKILKTLDNRSLDHADLMRHYLLDTVRLNSGKEYLENLKRDVNFTLPVSLISTLRPYQVTGYQWILSNLINGFGVILADEMGLGKTIQTISVICYLYDCNLLDKNSKTLILCPNIIVINWMREIKQHSELKFCTLDKIHKDCQIIISSYELFVSRYNNLDLDYGLIILDEAQKIKNSNTHTWKLLQGLNVRYRILLTGTPVENNLLDLWSIFQIVFPGFLGKKSDFQHYIDMPTFEKNEKLKKCISPFILRRKKEDCALDIPPKQEIVQYLDLSIEQAALYKKCLEEELKNDMKNTAHKFKLVTHLKMICNHPMSFSSDFTNEDCSNKWQFVKNFIDNLENQKLVIFTQYVDMGNLLTKLIKKYYDLDVPFISGKDSKEVKQKHIDSFQSDENCRVIVVSIRAGGSGITLTAASFVIMYDMWWNPAVMDQAVDRTHRIGQDKLVTIYYLITRGTLEEKIHQMIEKKRELGKFFLQSNEKWITKMSVDEIKELLTLG